MLEAWKAILEEIGPGTKIVWCKVCDPILCILTLEQIILAAGSDQDIVSSCSQLPVMKIAVSSFISRVKMQNL